MTSAIEPEKNQDLVPEVQKTELEEYEERTEQQIFDDDDFIGDMEEDN